MANAVGCPISQRYSVMMDANTNAKRLVARGYNQVAERYLRWHASPDATTERFLDEVDERVPHGSLVLDLGCGAGVPVTQRMLDARRVVGIDVSPAQLSLAHSLVPDGQLVQGDVTQLPFRPGAFDAAVALYSLVHVPRAEQLPTLRRVAECLRPGGVFAANFGTGGSDDSIQDDWLGVPMFFASFDPHTNERMVRHAGLRIEMSEVRAVDEDGQSVEFHWMIAIR